VITASGEQAVEILRALHDGRTMNKLGRQLDRLIQAVHTTGRPGHVALTVEITVPPGPVRLLGITPRVTADIPADLTDPNQDPLPFPDWETPATDREVDHRDPAAVPLHDN
jgi:hypothetical protein